MVEEKLSNKTHKGRPDLTGEHPAGDTGQLLLFLLFFATWLLDVFFLNITYSGRGESAFPLGNRMAYILLAISIILLYAGSKQVFRIKNKKPRVIKEGIFRWIRHPIYLGAVIFYIPFLLFAFSYFAAIVWVIIAGFYIFIARYEEKLLIEKFGEEYRQYRREVWFFLPFIKYGDKFNEG
ncbi:MAG: methyltransferase family protein [Bacteroidales bacterium]